MTEEIMTQEDYFKDEPIYLRKVIEELKQENNILKEKLERQRDYIVNYKNFEYEKQQKYRKAFERIQEVIYRTDSQHPASVANLVSDIR